MSSKNSTRERQRKRDRKRAGGASALVAKRREFYRLPTAQQLGKWPCGVAVWESEEAKGDGRIRALCFFHFSSASMNWRLWLRGWRYWKTVVIHWTTKTAYQVTSLDEEIEDHVTSSVDEEIEDHVTSSMDEEIEDHVTSSVDEEIEDHATSLLDEETGDLLYHCLKKLEDTLLYWMKKLKTIWLHWIHQLKNVISCYLIGWRNMIFWMNCRFFSLGGKAFSFRASGSFFFSFPIFSCD